MPTQLPVPHEESDLSTPVDEVWMNGRLLAQALTSQTGSAALTFRSPRPTDFRRPLPTNKCQDVRIGRYVYLPFGEPVMNIILALSTDRQD